MSSSAIMKPSEVQARAHELFTPEQAEFVLSLFENRNGSHGPLNYRDHLKHVISMNQPEFDRRFLNHFCDVTSRIRLYDKVKSLTVQMHGWLPHRRGLIDFGQPSSRTLKSTIAALQNLGMMYIITPPKEHTSKSKGESDLESLRVDSSLGHIMFIRSATPDLAASAAEYFDTTKRPIPVVSCGGGTEDHVTQALTNIYTLDRTFRKFGRIDGKTYVMAGDLSRSRTVHSDIHALRNYRDIKIIFVSPEELKLPVDSIQFLKDNNMSYEETTDMDGAVEAADAIMLTREQDDPDKPKIECDYSIVHLQDHHLAHQRKIAVMHPGPRGPELHPRFDADNRVLYWRAIRNGMWARTAMIFLILWQADYDFLFE